MAESAAALLRAWSSRRCDDCMSWGSPALRNLSGPSCRCFDIRSRTSLRKVDRAKLSLDVFEATLDAIDMRGQLELRKGRNLPFSIVAKSPHQELPVAQEPLSLFLRHAPESVTRIDETVQRQANAGRRAMRMGFALMVRLNGTAIRPKVKAPGPQPNLYQLRGFLPLASTEAMRVEMAGC